MSYFASVAGLPIVSGSLMIPLVGMWTADLQLATDSTISGAVPVVIGNLTLQGFVYRTANYGGQVSARLVGGYGGWRTTIPAQGYGHGAGVMLSTVLQDAAAACGEKISISKDTTIGNAYARANSPASDILWQMLSQGFIPAWYVDPSGVTQTKPWPTVTVSTPFTVTDQQPDEGVITIATEDYVSWMPGCTFSDPNLAGSFTSAGVQYVWTPDGQFRFEVLTGGQDRFLGALQAFVARQLAPTRFFGRYEYTIHSPSTSTIDGAPSDPAIGLPDVQNVPLVGDSISSYVPPEGGTCHIQFLNGVPTKPVCVWTSSNASHANMLGGTTPAAKLGDTVQSVIAGMVTVLPGSTLLVPPAPSPVAVSGVLVLQGLSPISGTITTGSGKVGMPV